jgi:phosphonate transport system ATP-binding protein
VKVNLTAVGLGYKNVGHSSGQVALADLNIAIASGEQVAIIGPSGAGKTSLLRVLATGLKPSCGDIQLADSKPWHLSAKRLKQLRASIGLVHQAPPLPPRQRVVTAVLAGKLGQWSILKSLLSLLYPLDSSGAFAALARLDLADKLFARCDQLSGGQLQRVGIARVLYQAPALLLADEPVSAMDPVLAEHSLRVLCADASARSATLVASLHAVDLALTHFPRVIGLRAGRVLFDCASAEVGRAELAALYANEQLPVVDMPAPVLDVLVPRC